MSVTVLLASCGSNPAPHMAGSERFGASRIIIDTDLGLYWDDVTALGMANVMQQRGQVQILGVMSDIRNSQAVAAIDAIDTAYGHGHIPIGAVAGSDSDTVPGVYIADLTARLPHAVRDSDQVPGAVSLYRRLLSAQPDHSVTIVALGAYTNLAGLLRSRPSPEDPLDGRALVEAKVKRIVIEDGLFPNGAPVPLTNTRYDIASARAVVSDPGWPAPIAWVDGYTGVDTKVGAMLCSTTPAVDPMRIVYEALFGCGPPGDGDWDGPTFLFAVGGTQGIFSELGLGGAAVMNANGGLSWQSSSNRRGDFYVHVADQEELNERIDGLLEAR